MAPQTSPSVQSKPWGQTRCVYRDQTHEVWHASIRRGGYSSRHYHTRKGNEFYVASGTLLVHEWENQYSTVPRVTHVLKAGDRVMVDDHEWHTFHAETDVELIETYFSHLKGEDIVRHDTGGLKAA